MVAQFHRHDIKWLAPSPMWDVFGDLSTEDSRVCFNRPAILRFNHDGFMDELLALMSYYPDRLAEWRVQPETWREPMATPPTAAKLSLAEPVSQLGKRLSREQTKRDSAVSASLVVDGSASFSGIAEQDPNKPLKLFQPVQQRFYLVTASLVCRRAGLPDRFIDTGKQEQPSFVLRRLIARDSTSIKTPDVCNPEECDEYALVQTAVGQQWRNITQHALLEVDQAAPDEERLPMFSIGFTDMENRKRKILSGLIPVAKREAYLSRPMFDEELAAEEELEQAAGDSGRVIQAKREALKRLFDMQVTGPWKELLEQADSEIKKEENWSDPLPIEESLDVPSPNNGDSDSRENNIKIIREQIQTMSWYVLIDLVEFLNRHINDVYRAFDNPANASELSGAKLFLYNKLAAIQLSDALKNDLAPAGTYHAATDVRKYLRDVLQEIIHDLNIAQKLEAVDVPYNRFPTSDGTTLDPAAIDNRWPRFLFPLADSVYTGPLPYVPAADIPDNIDAGLDEQLYKLDQLSQWVADALDIPDAEAPEVITFKELKMDSRDGWFVIRCIHEQPNCGPFFPAVLSKPTEPFKMASFFDPDAPGRQILIPTPLDISPAGLRKFNKNTTFMISDMLCGKIKNMRKITFGDLVLSVLPWPFHKDLPRPGKTGPCGSPGNNFGMYCSLSIPIVTLAALILLIIIVALFNSFFYWLPLLFTCFSIPGLKGKKS